MRIAVDLDDVTAQLVKPACEERGFDPATVVSWDAFGEMWGGTATLFDWLRETRMYRRLPEVPGAIEGIVKMHLAGHDIRFVTARPFWAKGDTLNWLERKIPLIRPSKRLHMGMINKLDADCDIYIDDGPHTTEAVVAAGRIAIKLNQPWNQGAACTHDADDWSEVLAHVLG